MAKAEVGEEEEEDSNMTKEEMKEEEVGEEEEEDSKMTKEALSPPIQHHDRPIAESV